MMMMMIIIIIIIIIIIPFNSYLFACYFNSTRINYKVRTSVTTTIKLIIIIIIIIIISKIKNEVVPCA
jgi:uncharacterized membrane protein (GlpM family)